MTTNNESLRERVNEILPSYCDKKDVENVLALIEAEYQKRETYEKGVTENFTWAAKSDDAAEWLETASGKRLYNEAYVAKRENALLDELEAVLRGNEDDQFGTNYEGVTDDLIDFITAHRQDSKEKK